MSHVRMKTVFLHFSNYLPWSIFFIAAAVGKPGFRGISMFLVFSVDLISLFQYLILLQSLVAQGVVGRVRQRCPTRTMTSLLKRIWTLTRRKYWTLTMIQAGCLVSKYRILRFLDRLFFIPKQSQKSRSIL